MASPIGKYWLFTINNPSDTFPVGDSIQSTLADSFANFPEIKYCLWQLEEAPTTGTAHYQGYIEFKANQRRNKVASILPGAHLEKRCGNADQARAYCGKEETRLAGPWEYGVFTPSLQGRRTDLENLRALLDNGAPIEQVAQEHWGDYLRYRPSILAYKAMKTVPRNSDTPPEVIIYFGPPGTGKSYRCRHDHGDDIFTKPKGKWWDGYSNQKTVYFEDFYGEYPYTEMLNVLDSGPCTVEIKGACIPLLATKFLFSSNKHPRDWWEKMIIERGEHALDAFKRRVTRIIHCRTVYRDSRPCIFPISEFIE